MKALLNNLISSISNSFKKSFDYVRGLIDRYETYVALILASIWMFCISSLAMMVLSGCSTLATLGGAGAGAAVGSAVAGPGGAAMGAIGGGAVGNMVVEEESISDVAVVAQTDSLWGVLALVVDKAFWLVILLALAYVLLWFAPSPSKLFRNVREKHFAKKPKRKVTRRKK